RLALGWNILGIVDLVNAVTMGVTSAVVQLQAAPSSGSAAAVSPLLLYPLVLVPTFGVPLALILHSLSIRQLGRRGASLTGSLLRERGQHDKNRESPPFGKVWDSRPMGSRRKDDRELNDHHRSDHRSTSRLT